MIESFLIGALAAFSIMFVLWVMQIFTKNAGVIDIGWASSLAVIAGIYAIKFDGYVLRQVILVSMVSFWAIRLSFLLIMRMIRDKKEDRRYQLLRKDWAPGINAKFFLLFEIEAVLALVLSVPFLIISLNPSSQISVIEVIGILIWVGAFTGEVIADEQLRKFITNPQNKGQVCQDGFWNYTRHPNYFFEWCMWVGYFIFAMGSPNGWLGIIAPVTMYFVLNKVTGIPFAEMMSLKSKGDFFVEYQKTTNIFFPGPKRTINQ